jgi:hypothetical protein
MTTRIFTVLIGTWLFLSAFAWPHTPGQRYAALICGALTVLLSLGTLYFAGLRYLTAAVGVMLLVASVSSFSPSPRTFWHNAILALAIFVSALMDRGPARAHHERELYGRT